jgi:hypothetical protein
MAMFLWERVYPRLAHVSRVNPLLQGVAAVFLWGGFTRDWCGCGTSIAAEAGTGGDGNVFVGAGLPAILGASFAAEAAYKGGGGISVGAGFNASGARNAG